TANEISDWKICCVAAIAMGHDVRRPGFFDAGRLQEIVDRNASPRRIELRPFCNAVDICLDCGLREGLELYPAPRSNLGSAELQAKSPVFNLDLRGGSRRKNRKVGRYILTGWHSIFRRLLSPLGAKSARNRRLVVHVVLPAVAILL